MKRTLVFVLALGLMLLASCASLGSNATLQTVSVSASATVTTRPDCASIWISAEAIEDTTVEAKDATSRLIGEAVEILKNEFGITDEDLRTTRMSVSPYTEWRDGGSVLVGQRASQQIEVKLRKDIDEAGKVYDKLSILNGISISSVSYYKEDTAPEVEEARMKAVQEARKKAEAYAEGLGMKVGDPISISDGSSFSYTPYMNKTYAVAEAAMAMDSYVSTSYYVGDLTVSDEVTVLFTLLK